MPWEALKPWLLVLFLASVSWLGGTAATGESDEAVTVSWDRLIAAGGLFTAGGSGDAEGGHPAGTPLSGPYFGQPPPGLTPVRFAAGIVPVDIMGCPVFTEDGLEAYWSIVPGGHIRTSAEVDGQWTAPGNAPFSAALDGSDFPHLSPDGQKLFFTSSSYPGPDLDQKENIWVTEREGDGWGSPSPLPAVINDRLVHWQVSVAANGNLYFQSNEPAGGDLYVSAFQNGEYQAPQPLPPEINSSVFEMGPFIAPDESYLIFSRFDISHPIPDMYISFRDGDGWTAAVAMDAINLYDYDEVCPNVTRDGRYLIFLSSLGGGTRSYWVSSEIIELYRPDCCVGVRGDANGNGGDEPTISDVGALIDAKFISGSCQGIIDCYAEADLNQSGGTDPGCDDITISDISILIDYLFITGQSMGLPACPAGDGLLEIPNGADVVVDGHLQPGEWDDAEMLLLSVEDAVDVTVLVKHDGTSLLAAYCYSYVGDEGLCFPEILIDPENDKSVGWQYDDWWFHVSGTDCEMQGTYNVYTDCSVVQSDWQGVPNFDLTPEPPPIDTFEVRVPLSKIGVAVGGTVGVTFRVEFVPAMFAYWPATATADSPATWGTAVIEP